MPFAAHPVSAFFSSNKSGGAMTLTKEDIELIKKFCQRYADSGMWECPICGAVDDCKDWCVMPLLTKISEVK